MNSSTEWCTMWLTMVVKKREIYIKRWTLLIIPAMLHLWNLSCGETASQHIVVNSFQVHWTGSKSLTWNFSALYKNHSNSWNRIIHHSVPLNGEYTHTHPFNGPFSRTTQVSRYQKGKTNLDLKQETVSGSGISWDVCKSALRSRQITTPATHHSVFYRLDALPATQPTASKHWRDEWWIIRLKSTESVV